MSQTIIAAGFMPLTDSMLLVVAEQQGFAAAEGLSLRLVRETSWANIRDRVGVGHFDVAHMLAPMPIAANLGLSPLPVPFIAAMALGHGGNAVTVSLDLWAQMIAHGATDDLDPATTGLALAAAVHASPRRLRFGVVHQDSSHNHELRYWLAASGVVPDRDVEIVVLPPPLLPDALASGAIDGYCVGEPWGGVAVRAGHGRIVTTKSRIWRSSPDKVLGMRAAWADANPDTLAALIRALHNAALWCSAPANLPEAARIMAQPQFLDQPADLVGGALTGHLAIGAGATRQVERFYVPYAGAANFPWKSHAVWFYAQMVRWGQVQASPQNLALAAASFRPDLYRAALAPLGVPMPPDDYKIDGLITKPLELATPAGPLLQFPDGFFDGTRFDWSAPL
ncbi:MAG: nitrate transporter [Devosia sp.]|uniref:CmpA/NrtA family ABC transporter substrate-binding protein n=1 Tax=Devosia sp. TaxID=1871048 RepID=UPI0026135D72|nr:CmpA/NrtA family ABC transporter substrate-binding protein [Devosia sp.]MDB5527490.1 nitrate transporter [Devosia sp.]